MNYSLDKLYDLVAEFLDPKMDSVMRSISDPDPKESEYMILPSGEHADLSPQQISRLIALSANKYSTSVRLASMARAKAKIAEARYKHKFKVSSGVGANAAQREANAAEAASNEYNEMILCQAIVELIESIESTNRIASESARKMMHGADQSYKAEGRFSDHASSLTAKDFSGY